MKNWLLVWIFVLALAAGGCASPKPPTAAPATGFDVILLPTDDFSYGVAVELAKVVSSDTGLRVRAMLPMGTRDWTPYADGRQYDPVALRNLAAPVIARLRAQFGGKVVAILTTRDINGSDRTLRFVFAQHYNDKISVISSARMVLGAPGAAARPEVVKSRLRKMLLRTVGMQYYGLARSTDLREVMYSPIMSLDDLDAMGLELKTKDQSQATP